MNRLTVKLDSQTFRWILLVAVVVNLALIVGRALSFQGFFSMADSLLYLLEPVVLLLSYAGVALWLHRIAGPAWQIPLHLGTLVGVCSGLIWIVNITLESLVDLSARASHFSSLALILGAFFCWGVAGFWCTLRTGSALLGILAAVCCAMVSIMIAVTFGFLLPYAFLPRLAYDMTNDPDFLRSGWHDTSAFAIANTFDSGFSHLLAAPLVGLVFGTFGGVLGKGWMWLNWNHRKPVEQE